MDRPETITKQELQNPPAEQSASMQRGQAFAHDGTWAGVRRLPRWRLDRLAPPWGLRHLRLHHQWSDDGRVRPWGSDLVEIGEGDFIYIPAQLIHRESVAAQGGAGADVRVDGVGPTVFNVVSLPLDLNQ